jgi:cell division protein FtsB
MFKKINSYYHRIPWGSLRDPKNIGLIVFLVIVLLISWSGVKALQTNYSLQKQISLLKQQNDVQQLQNINQQLQDQYYGTNQYLNITARQEFGLGQPGETELIVPKAVAMAHLAPITTTTTNNSSITNSNQPTYQKNFHAWVDFILHRQNSN